MEKGWRLSCCFSPLVLGLEVMCYIYTSGFGLDRKESLEYHAHKLNNKNSNYFIERKKNYMSKRAMI
jgi:hypothetical protein